MIFINPDILNLPPLRRAAMDALSAELRGKAADARSDFIDAKRDVTWANAEVLETLRSVAGNKCWYSEVQLDGADPNVDHFRPKGQVREVDRDLQNTGNVTAGYWWLALEFSNYRLA